MGLFGFFRRRRRRRLRQRPLPPEWTEILRSNFEIFERLEESDRVELLRMVQVFLDEKSFEGCGGLEITEEIRVTIAAQACLLMLRQEDPHYYPTLYTILVYPHAYVARSTEVLPGGMVIEGESARLGESWVRGSVVLSWDDVRRGAADIADGHNVVLHEFAHQLDQEDGSSDGAPILERRSRYVTWARVLGAEFEDLRTKAQAGRRTDIDAYGATNPAEFFAVVTEAFFERPRSLRKKHPELYEELKAFYRQDPIEFHRRKRD